jgi:hypothetical protein
VIGEVGGETLEIDATLSVPVVDLAAAHSGGLASLQSAQLL